MPNIGSIITNAGTAVASRITNAHAYEGPPDSVNQLPAVIVLLENFDPSIAFGGNSFEGTLRFIFLIERSESGEAWRRLWTHLDVTGSGTSVIAALRADPRFGSAVDSSFVARVENIGGRQMMGGVYLGFDVLVPFVHTVA